MVDSGDGRYTSGHLIGVVVFSRFDFTFECNYFQSLLFSDNSQA